MVSSFNENDLIDILLHEYNTNNKNYKKIVKDEINSIIFNNTIGENQEIIIHYVGDVYDAIKLFNTNIKKMDIDKYENKELFYKDLAYISLHTFISDTIKDLISDEND